MTVQADLCRKLRSPVLLRRGSYAIYSRLDSSNESGGFHWLKVSTTENDFFSFLNDNLDCLFPAHHDTSLSNEDEMLQAATSVGQAMSDFVSRVIQPL